MKAPEAVPIKLAKCEGAEPPQRPATTRCRCSTLERAEQITTSARLPSKREHATLTDAHGYHAAARDEKKVAQIYAAQHSDK